MRVLLIVMLVAVMAAILGGCSYVFLETTDRLTELLRFDLTDALIPVREAQLAHSAFDRMNFEARYQAVSFRAMTGLFAR